MIHLVGGHSEARAAALKITVRRVARGSRLVWSAYIVLAGSLPAGGKLHSRENRDPDVMTGIMYVSVFVDGEK